MQDIHKSSTSCHNKSLLGVTSHQHDKRYHRERFVSALSWTMGPMKTEGQDTDKEG